MEKRINHKFNVFDECIICNIIRDKRPYVGNGYNPIFTKRFETFYSKDFGKTWQKEYINCKKNKPMTTYTTTQKIAIEQFYNKDRESDVQYCRFDDIPNSLKVEIKKILKL